jgi:hypothetical protein
MVEIARAGTWSKSGYELNKAFGLPSCARKLPDMQITPRLPVIAGIALLAALHQAQAANSTPDLLNDCQSLERGKQGSGRMIDIPKTREALVCWGYMKAMQDLSVWVDQNGNRILGSCPSEIRRRPSEAATSYPGRPLRLSGRTGAGCRQRHSVGGEESAEAVVGGLRSVRRRAEFSSQGAV